ncbi:MAG: helix-turn-helix domain-containing protein [Actinomycetota bacterium]|nr:helix-turn-helix domain-containing protein [Actinomycetota bacterium]
MTRVDPGALRWLVGIELRDRRLRARKTTAASARMIGTNHSKIVHMETGRYGQKAEDVRALLAAYGTQESEVERIIALVEADDGPSWWDPWAKVVSPDFAVFLGLEGMAEREIRYDPLAIPALFQTEAYALAATNLSRRVPLDQLETVVELRMERQRRLTAEVPLNVHSVIEESALRRVAGDRNVMGEQLERLIELADLPNVTISVLPTAHGLRAAGFGDFNLLTLPSGREVVYVETLYQARYVYDRDEVRGYNLMVDSVRPDLLDREESVMLIKQVIAETA